MTFAATIGLVMLAAVPFDAAIQTPAHDSVAMLAHWRCAVWAEMSGDEVEAERHFSTGLEIGRRFADAAREGKISSDEWSEQVPLGVALTARGPSTDFVLGRLFEFASDDAYRQVAQRDATGTPLAPRDYINDAAVQRVIAGGLYTRSNCSVL